MSTDTIVTKNEPAPEPTLFYADRITEFGIGPAVTKLTLAIEKGPNNFVPTNIVVLPTHSLIEAITYILNSVKDNEALREPLLNQMQKFHDHIKSGL